MFCFVPSKNLIKIKINIVLFIFYPLISNEKLQRILKLLDCCFLNERDVFFACPANPKVIWVAHEDEETESEAKPPLSAFQAANFFRNLKQICFKINRENKMKLLPSIFFASALGEIPFVFTKDEIEKFAKSWNMQVDKSHSTTYEIMGTCQNRII